MFFQIYYSSAYGLFYHINEKKTIVIVTHANPIKLIAKRMQNLTYKKTSELRFATCAQKIYDLRYSKQDGYEVIAEYNINKDMEG